MSWSIISSVVNLQVTIIQSEYEKIKQDQITVENKKL